jgi:serine/threonine protein kinase
VSFEAELGRVLVEGRDAVLEEATRLTGDAVLPPVLVSKRGLEPHDFSRLELELLACERLEHPGLARFFGATHTPELGTVLAFERLGPNPLLLLAENRPSFRDPGTVFYPLPPGVALELAFDMILALEHTHAQEFVHGGVTLTNLLVRTPSGAGTASDILGHVVEGAYEGVLAGLGGARSNSFLYGLRHGWGDAKLAPGTDPILAAPEALLGVEDQPVFTPAVDTYSFGLVFYTLLTGRHPYGHAVLPEELKSRDVLVGVKKAELKREISPILPRALERIPLHDTPLVGGASTNWPAFRTAVEHVWRRCVALDPRERPTATALREFFEREFRILPTTAGEARSWTQNFFQMRAASNRLRGDLPSEGISVREQENVLVVEERRPGPSGPDPGTSLTEALAAPDGSLVILRREDPAKKDLGPRPLGLVGLRELLVATRAKRPWNVTGPFIVTTTGLGRRDLALCQVYSLGRAQARLRILESSVVERVRVTLGRGSENDIVLRGASVSTHHAVLERKGGFWFLEDLNSTNGTKIGERRLARGGSARVTRSLTTLGLGPDTELVYMDESDLREYVNRALEVVAQAMGTPARGMPRPAASPGNEAPAEGEAKEEMLFASRATWDQTIDRTPTAKFPRDLTRRVAAAFPLARVDMPPDLEARLSRFFGATFVVHLTGSRTVDHESADEVLELVRRAPAELVRIEACLPDGKRVLVHPPDST